MKPSSEQRHPEPADPPTDMGAASRQLRWSIEWLRTTNPSASAHRTVTRPQFVTAATVFLCLIVGLILAPRASLIAVLTAITIIYSATITLRLVLAWLSLGRNSGVDVPDDVALAVRDEDLPRVSVIVPAYREPTVIGGLIEALTRLDYPRDRLEVLLTLEADDDDTIAAAQAAIGPSPLRVVLVPPAQPRTKPKALNYALLESTGDVVTVYDAEDLPEPLQLRRAAVVLASDPGLGCVQAQLAYFNGEQNSLTRWFTLEYAMWFEQFLPGLMRLRGPIPLGGTSNHFRRSVLIHLGGWDPFNVTEDADLGLRLYRSGWRVAVLSSITLEEANSDFVNWVKQRSRWYKGYLQTWLLNVRHPARACRDFGWRGFALMNLFVGGTPMLALLNPWFWALTVCWFTLHPAFIQQLFPAPLLYLGLVAGLLGNALLIYAFVLVATTRSDRGLLRAALTMPVYFVMMSAAAYKALVQLVFNASYWEKTAHGLSPDPVSTTP